MRLTSLTRIFNLNDSNWGRGGGSNPGGPDNQPPRRPQQNRPAGGPPDLDELWKDFNQKLGGLFGGRKGNPPPGGGSSLPPRARRFGAGLIIAVLALLWLASGFFIVQEGQVAVITQFGKYKTTARPGFQWRLPYPIQAHETVNVSQLRTIEVGFRNTSRSKVLQEALMLTDDENIVDLQYVVQYRLREDGARDYLFRTRQPDESVKQAAETAMREIVGKKTMDFVLYEGRTQVASEVVSLMQNIMDHYGTGILISNVAIQNAQPPEQVQAAFDDAVKAGQDRERQINEGQAYANEVIPRAAGAASRLIQEAEGYRQRIIETAEGDSARFTQVLAEYRKAPQVTRDRLYLETMQNVFENTSKVFIDSKSGNNLLYLPLDKLMEQVSRDARQSVNAPVSGTSTPPTVPSTPPVSSDAARDGLRSRDRVAR